jgi:hypothetical protein
MSIVTSFIVLNEGSLDAIDSKNASRRTVDSEKPLAMRVYKINLTKNESE